MTLASALFGLFVVVLGVAGLFSPERLLALVTRTQSRLGLPILAGFRVAVGLALVLAAPTSRASVYLQALGALSILSGIATPFFGARRLEAILDWWRERPPWFVRLWSAFVVLFGLSLIWAVWPVQRAA